MGIHTKHDIEVTNILVFMYFFDGRGLSIAEFQLIYTAGKSPLKHIIVFTLFPCAKIVLNMIGFCTKNSLCPMFSYCRNFHKHPYPTHWHSLFDPTTNPSPISPQLLLPTKGLLYFSKILGHHAWHSHLLPFLSYILGSNMEITLLQKDNKLVFPWMIEIEYPL